MSDRVGLDLFVREDFETFVGRFPGVTIVHQWGNASVAKVGGKLFAIFCRWRRSGDWHVAFKCSPLSFVMLQEMEGIVPAPYLARAQWVDVAPLNGLSQDELAAYVGNAHRLIAHKLTRAAKRELGLDAYLASASELSADEGRS